MGHLKHIPKKIKVVSSVEALQKLHVRIVALNLFYAVLLDFALSFDPAWLVLNDLLQQKLGEEDGMEGKEGDQVHSMVIVRHVLEQLARRENNNVDAHEDAQVRDKLKQVHPDTNVDDCSRHVFPRILTHAAQLNTHSEHSCDNSEKGTGREHHGEEEDPTQLHEELVILRD